MTAAAAFFYLFSTVMIGSAFMVIAAVLLMRPKVHEHLRTLDVACVLAFVGIWIEKGMGLIIPGFIPSTLHEVVEYLPSAVEWKVSAADASTGETRSTSSGA